MKKKIIIDTDPGIDDAIALILAIKSDFFEIVGISTTYGNASVEQTTQNTFQILSWLGRLDIPVFQGAAQPLEKELVTALETHGIDGLGEIFLPKIQQSFQKNAVDFLLSQKNKGIILVALGPLTTIARCLQKDPDFLEGFEGFFTMGGAFRTAGNSSPVAEFNYWSDPQAAEIVFEKGKNIQMIPLDVTRKIVLTPQLREKCKNSSSDILQKIYKITQFYTDFHWEQEKIRGCVINDPLVIAQLIDPSLCQGKEYFVGIETLGKSIGQTLVDELDFYKKQPNAKVFIQTDAQRFFDLFFEMIEKND